MTIRYSKELKKVLVGLYVEQGVSFKNLAEEYGPSVDSMRNLVKKSKPIMIGTATPIRMAFIIISFI